MAEVNAKLRGTFKTFDYSSINIDASWTFSIERDLEMVKLMGERYDISPVDEHGTIDVFKFDQIVRQFVRESFMKQKSQIEKLPISVFGMKQFEGTNWEDTD